MHVLLGRQNAYGGFRVLGFGGVGFSGALEELYKGSLRGATRVLLGFVKALEGSKMFFEGLGFGVLGSRRGILTNTLDTH